MRISRSIRPAVWFLGLATAWASCLMAAAQEGGAEAATGADPDVTREQLEARLAESLSGATLVGHFTVTGDGQTSTPKAERYSLRQVKKVGENWLFMARIQYGDHDVTVPLNLPIRWAGDTPVITVDDIPVPGLGTFTSRVMIYEHHYAGFWRGKDHGGHLYGIIERDADLKAPDSDE